MEVSDSFLCLGKVFLGFPCIVLMGVSLPFHQILDSSSMLSAFENFFNTILLMVIDEFRRRAFIFFLIWELAFLVWHEYGFIEYGVDLPSDW